MGQLKDGSTVGGNLVYHKGNLGEATTVKSGLISASDKTKLDGIADSANNYTHPSYTSRSIDTSGIEVIDVVTSDTSGHITNITKRSIQAASTGVQGVVQLNDTISSTSTAQAATANAVKTAYDLANAALAKSGDTGTGTFILGTVIAGASQIVASAAKLQVDGFMRTGTIYLHEGLTPASGTDSALETVSGELRWGGNKIWTASNFTDNHVNWDAAYTHSQDAHSYLPLSGGTVTGDTTFDGGVSTTVQISCDDAGEAVLNLMGTSQGTGRIFVGQSATYGGGIEYNGDSSPVSTGAGSDKITLYRKTSGTMYWTARNSHADNNWEFRDDVKAVTFTTTSYGTSANWKTGYDHSQVAHAPSNAQANADITKAEIEAKLTGAITSHTHSYLSTSGGIISGDITINGNILTTKPMIGRMYGNEMWMADKFATVSYSANITNPTAVFRSGDTYSYFSDGNPASWEITGLSLAATTDVSSRRLLIFAHGNYSGKLKIEVLRADDTWATALDETVTHYGANWYKYSLSSAAPYPSAWSLKGLRFTYYDYTGGSNYYIGQIGITNVRDYNTFNFIGREGGSVYGNVIISGADLTANEIYDGDGGNSTQWNTAYTHSQSAHSYLPLTGGTVTGLSRFEGSTIVDTDTGNYPLYITRLGETYQGFKIYADDRNAFIDYVEDVGEASPGNLWLRNYQNGGAVLNKLLIGETDGQFEFNDNEIWHAGNDGSGSGLDADTLDGAEGSHYLDRANHTGTQAIATVSGLQAALDSKSDTAHTHDGRYYTEAEADARFLGISAKAVDSDKLDGYDASDFQIIERTTQQVNLPVGWYTIAVNAGNRAIARFGLKDINSSDHQSCVFYASHHFGMHSELTVLHSGRYNGSPFKYIRIKEGDSHAGALLQVYLDDSTNQVQAFILGDNFQDSGWIVKDFVPDGTDPGSVSNFAALTNEAAKIDLDSILDGGIATTGELYAGGNTSQYKVWHAGNDGSGSGLDADTVDGKQASDLMGSTLLNGYDGLNGPNSGTSSWIRTTTSGIIPYQSGGSSSLGTSTWPFTNVYSNNIYESGTALTSKYLGINSNAVSATKLQTARTINGVSFDGTANITIADATKLPLSGGILTGTIDVHVIDTGNILTSGNSSAANADQFYIKHNYGNVEIGNLRGSTYLTSGDLYIGDGTTNNHLILKKVSDGSATQLQFYNGTTRVGEIGCYDDTWLRINNSTAKNIYTPRYIRADGGFFVDGTSKGIDTNGNFFGGTIAGASDANVTNWNTAYTHSQASHAYLPLAGGTVTGNTTFSGKVSANGTIEIESKFSIDYNSTTESLDFNFIG